MAITMSKQYPFQVQENAELLKKMMSDLGESDPLFRPTNYWSFYERIFLPELATYGLKNFRHRRRSVLGSFGATDLLFSSALEIDNRFKHAWRLAELLNTFIKNSSFISLRIEGLAVEWVTPYYFSLVEDKFKKINMSLENCPTSLVGNPEDIIKIKNGHWSTAHLQYCSMFADVARHVPFEPGWIICELGAGMGRNVEIMAHLFNQATFLLFDIPPQLYVAHQYLQAVFGDRILEYEQAITLSPKGSDLPREAIGKILILPSWCMPKWSHVKTDIFWNSASFQEMEPDVVQNYLDMVIQMSPEWIYINALPKGNSWRQEVEGGGGMHTPVLEEYYFTFLNRLYDLMLAYDTDYFLRQRDYKSYLFKRKAI